MTQAYPLYKRVADYFRSTPARFGFGSSSKEIARSIVIQDKSEPPEFLDGSFGEIAGGDTTSETDSHFKGLLRKYGREFWILGWQDGRRSQLKGEIDEIAKSEAFFARDELTAYYEGRSSELKTQEILTKDVLHQTKAEYEECDSYYKSIIRFFRKNPRYYSRALAVIYLVVAVLLVIADIPLALKLTQQGFDLDLGFNYEIRDLFTNPLMVIQENWEVFVLAAGIALCSIYIKIFFDNFHDRPSIEGETDDEERRQKRKSWRIFTRSVLALSVFTIFMLGLFRFQSIDKPRERSSDSREQITLRDFTDQGSQGEPITKSQTVEDNLGKHLITATTFILITLLFPIVSGVCASLGMNCWHNRRELRHWQANREMLNTAVQAATREYEEAVREKANWDSLMGIWRAEDAQNHIVKLLLNYYNHGYRRGYLAIDTLEGSDFFELAKSLRGKLVTHSIRRSIQRTGNV